VRGEVTFATGAGVGVELAAGLPGFVKRAHLPADARADPSTLVGSELEGLVLQVRLDEGHACVYISPRHLAAQRCKAVVGKRRTVPARVTGANRGGLLVHLHGLAGFVPRSELPAREAAEHARLVGTDRELYVIRASVQQVIASAYPPRERRRRAEPKPRASR
jgi:ribosomal protein S1